MIISLQNASFGEISPTYYLEKRTAWRQMALQYAVSEVLRRAPDVESFPGEVVVITAERFDVLVEEIVELANSPGWATNPGYTWTPVFQFAEAYNDLQRRGYRPGIASVAPVPLPITPAEPPPYEPVEPVTYELPVTDLVIVDRPREPEPVTTQVETVDIQEPPPPPEAETTEITIDAKTALWIGGGVALLLALVALGKAGSV